MTMKHSELGRSVLRTPPDRLGPGRAVEPPSEEMYEMLARRREGKVS